MVRENAFFSAAEDPSKLANVDRMVKIADTFHDHGAEKRPFLAPFLY
eukprot:COSAG06_NODE_8724_length_2087_cov_1.937123_4_plen_47_part_00